MNKLTSKLKFFVLVSTLLFIYTGCSDDGDGGSPSPADNLIGTWTVDDANITAMVGNQSLTDFLINVGGLSPENADIAYALFELSLLSEISGSITFKDDNTYVSNFGGSADDGTWNLSSDNKTLTLDQGTVDEIELEVISISERGAEFLMSQMVSEDLDGDPETPDVPIDVDVEISLYK